MGEGSERKATKVIIDQKYRQTMQGIFLKQGYTDSPHFSLNPDQENPNLVSKLPSDILDSNTYDGNYWFCRWVWGLVIKPFQEERINNGLPPQNLRGERWAESVGEEWRQLYRKYLEQKNVDIEKLPAGNYEQVRGGFPDRIKIPKGYIEVAYHPKGK